MFLYSPDIPPEVAAVIRKLPPDVKKGVKEALRALAMDPYLGETLTGALQGLMKYRVRRYRIVYKISGRRLRVYGVGHRREIYDQMTRITS